MYPPDKWLDDLINDVESFIHTHRKWIVIGLIFWLAGCSTIGYFMAH